MRWTSRHLYRVGGHGVPVDVEDMMTMLEKSRKRMKEIDDGKLGDIPADY